MRVIFTDFDGVLHPKAAAAHLSRSSLQAAEGVEGLRKRGLFVFTRWLAEAIRRAPDVEDIRVVIHSSWRAQFRDDELRRFVPELEQWMLGSVGFPTLARDAAILKWLEMMGPKVSEHLVLDDVPQLFAGGPSKWAAALVCCDPERGLSEPRVQLQVREFLKGRKKEADDDLPAIEFESVKFTPAARSVRSA